MKLRLLFTLLLFFFISISNLYSGTELGLFVGLSTPNDQINNIYNSSNIELSTGGIGKFFTESATSGYHVGAKINYSLSDDFIFTGSIAWHKFPESRIDVKNPETGDTAATLFTSQNIIPLTVGLNFYLIQSIVGIYGTGELSYNYMHSSVDADYNGVPLPIDESPSYNRVGFALGAGVDLDVVLTKLNLEAKYNIANLIGKESGEETKTYFSLSLGVFF